MKPFSVRFDDFDGVRLLAYGRSKWAVGHEIVRRRDEARRRGCLMREVPPIQLAHVGLEATTEVPEYRN